MLPLLVIHIQRSNNNLHVFFFSEKIGIGSIHKKGFQVVMLDVAGISFLDTEEVFIGNILLVRTVSFPDVLLQPVHGAVQVNEQVGLDELLVNNVEQALVQPELIFGQVHFCKQQAFGKKIIGYSDALKKIFLLNQVFQLFVPFGHKKKLERESILFWIFIKLGQKRIVGKLLQYQPCIVMSCQQVSQRGFAGADIAFYGDEMVVHWGDGQGVVVCC